MEITYLNLMKNTPVINNKTNYGKTEEEIENFQLNFSINFPKSYLEFLFIGGDYCNLSIPNSQLDFMDETQEAIKTKLSNEKLELEGGDFWVVSELDGGESFHFFYFNDPDAEDPENPPVYGSYPAFLDEGYSLKEKLADSFSEYIEAKIKAYT